MQFEKVEIWLVNMFSLIKCPKLSGYLHDSYKEYFRMVLLAMCGASYCSTTLFDFRSHGSNKDYYTLKFGYGKGP